MTESAAIDAAEPAHVRPAWAPLTLVAFVGLVIMTNVASGLWARWVDTNPEGLLVLSSRNRYLALTLAAGVPVSTYVVIAFLRVGAAFVVCHMIGRAYHDDAIGWFRKYLGVTHETIGSFNRGFARAEWVLIPFFAGSNIVAALSGVHRTPPVRLAVLLSIGIAGRLALDVVAGADVRGAAGRLPRVAAALPVVGRGDLGRARPADQPTQPPRRLITPRITSRVRPAM